ncbi:MAG: hypothetical protein HGA57_00570 [Chlorobium limicola]|jgi:uncharacterized membrane protein|uniref:Uncharacterized protein n=1 Tax=Chlorobium limicola (strain DSM 245 / NBRC 103803 / 6330) TaxID=290315 RepID=B3EI92_CHLL2|nr:hypothetical protein [Chlorobium limicola]ACD89922.1 conserved hypothetical protein [Chlorobium limicola DSM 245]NTV19868.1 hypothetical protein [Chlorobium limicola]
MKFFPEPESRKRFMKSGLPVILAVAWAPIVWMLFMAFLAPLLLPVTKSFILVQVIVVPLTAISLIFLLRLFRSLSERFYGEKA